MLFAKEKMSVKNAQDGTNQKAGPLFLRGNLAKLTRSSQVRDRQKSHLQRLYALQPLPMWPPPPLSSAAPKPRPSERLRDLDIDRSSKPHNRNTYFQISRFYCLLSQASCAPCKNHQFNDSILQRRARLPAYLRLPNRCDRQLGWVKCGVYGVPYGGRRESCLSIGQVI